MTSSQSDLTERLRQKLDYPPWRVGGRAAVKLSKR